MNTKFAAKVRTVLVILHERFLYLCFLLWFEMGGAVLEKDNDIYL